MLLLARPRRMFFGINTIKRHTEGEDEWNREEFHTHTSAKTKFRVEESRRRVLWESCWRGRLKGSSWMLRERTRCWSETHELCIGKTFFLINFSILFLRTFWVGNFPPSRRLSTLKFADYNRQLLLLPRTHNSPENFARISRYSRSKYFILHAHIHTRRFFTSPALTQSRLEKFSRSRIFRTFLRFAECWSWWLLDARRVWANWLIAGETRKICEWKIDGKAETDW